VASMKARLEAGTQAAVKAWNAAREAYCVAGGEADEAWGAYLRDEITEGARREAEARADAAWKAWDALEDLLIALGIDVDEDEKRAAA
jgi:hypothetical protein